MRSLSSLNGNIGSCTSFVNQPTIRSHPTKVIHANPDKTKVAMITALFQGNLEPPSSKAKTRRMEAAKLRKAPVRSSLWADFLVKVCQNRGRASVARCGKCDGRNNTMHTIAKAPAGALESQVISKSHEDDQEDSLEKKDPSPAPVRVDHSTKYGAEDAG